MVLVLRSTLIMQPKLLKGIKARAEASGDQTGLLACFAK